MGDTWGREKPEREREGLEAVWSRREAPWSLKLRQWGWREEALPKATALVSDRAGPGAGD